MPVRTVAVIMSPLTLVLDGTLSSNADSMQWAVPIAFPAWPQAEVNAEDR